MTASSKSKVFDLTIIGAGPTGLFGAFYAGMREMTCKVIDALPQAGGQITALYPEKFIYDTPGFHSIQGKELVGQLVQQVKQWDTEMALGEQAQTLERVPVPDGEGDERCWAITTDVATHFTRTIVIAAGIGAFRPRKLPNESIDRFESAGVEYFVSDLEVYRDKRVLIVGGGDSAVDWALATDPIAKEVTLIHRREGFRAHESSLKKLAASGVSVKIWHELGELLGDGSSTIKRTKTSRSTLTPSSWLWVSRRTWGPSGSGDWRPLAGDTCASTTICKPTSPVCLPPEMWRCKKGSIH
jgi:thioredoxin reductase (NADPH)